MIRESNDQYWNVWLQLKHDKAIRKSEELNSLIINGAKGLSVLNSGAVVAVFALVQALIEPIYGGL